MTLSFAEHLFGKRYKDLTITEKRKYQAEYNRHRREGLDIPARNAYNKHKAEYRRQRREAGRDADKWNAVEANRRAASHNNKVRNRYGEAVSSNLPTKELAAWWEVQDKVCYLCEEEGKDFDHVVPLSRGGEHSLSNIRICCTSCNSMKSKNTLEELLHSIPNKKQALEQELLAIQSKLAKLSIMESNLQATV